MVYCLSTFAKESGLNEHVRNAESVAGSVAALQKELHEKDRYYVIFWHRDDTLAGS